MTSKIEGIIGSIIATSNIERAIKLRDACDMVHSSGETVNFENIDITPDSLPKDDIYEELNKLIKMHQSLLTKLDIGTNKGYHNKKTKVFKEARTVEVALLSDFWMGSIIKKDQYLTPNVKVVVMPKLDGCSCCVRFTKNESEKFELEASTTRGVKKGFETRSTNLNDKVIDLIGDLIDNLNKGFTIRGIKSTEITQITFRGEIVIKDKTKITSAAAPYVAGKINGGSEVWEKAKDNLEYVPYETTRVYYHDSGKIKDFTPTQTETFEILKSLNFLKIPVLHYSGDKLDDIKAMFEKLDSEITHPIDGVVYCSEDWQYPRSETDTMDSVYGKYAWKPSSEIKTSITEIHYNITRTGQLGLEVLFEPVENNGKTWARSKTAISRMLGFPDIGIGSNVSIKIMNEMSAQIVEAEAAEIVKNRWVCPKVCPFCGAKTELKKSGQTVVLRCTNASCRAINSMKIETYLKTLNIKGFGPKSIESLPNGFISELPAKLNIKGKTLAAPTRQLFVALGFGGEQTVDKWINSTKLKGRGELTVDKNYNEVCEILVDKLEEKDKNEFLEDYVELFCSFKELK